jgi:tetratricopeptide (TPR) repeat protein
MKDSSKKKRPGKLEPNGPPFIPPEAIPDRLKVPKDTILLVPDTQDFVDPPHFVKAGQHRDWFDSYFYHCLPLVMGNQHGFLMLATYSFVCRWNGSNGIDGVSIHILEPVLEPNYLTLESHFGFGILTIQSRYIFRTPDGVNLMVKDPPNYPIHGFSWMNAVVETDNLRRDFTFNIKITQPHLDIYIPRGTPIGCLLPYPRYFLDGYNMEELKDEDELRKSERTVSYFAKEREDFDASPRHRYMEGVDIYNIEFKHHQKTLDKGKWWFSKRKKHIPVHLSEEDVEYSDKSILSSITNIFKKFLLLTSDAIQDGESSNSPNGPIENSEVEGNSSQAISDNSNPLHGKKLSSAGKEESVVPAQIQKTEATMNSPSEKKSPEEATAKCPVTHNAAQATQQDAVAKCPVKHDTAATAKAPADSHEEPLTSRISLKPENFPDIMELNADLPEASITIYLPPKYDKSLAPVKAERLRAWFEQDTKTKDHARFCLPLTMGGGVGWFILSPATFTITWDGDPTHNAQVEILDACSHAEIDNHSAYGSFTVQSQFVPRTKKPGDFVFIKGIGNQYRLPYYFLEAMLEAWWSPANFGLVAMLNQPCNFTIQKGEPIAQMFAINVEQAAYPLVFRDGYPAHWEEWDIKRRDPSYTGKNLDYLRGLWPDEKPVCPHFKSWGSSGAILEKPSDTSLEKPVIATPQKSIRPAPEKLIIKPSAKSVASDSPSTTGMIVQNARQALNRGDIAETERLLCQASIKAVQENTVGADLISTTHQLGFYYVRECDFEKAMAVLKQALNLCHKAHHVDSGRLANILADLGYTERMTNLLPAAEEHYAAALEVWTSMKDEVLIANGMCFLGSLYDQMGRHDDSESLLLEAFEIRKRKLGDRHPDTLFIKNGLACLYTHQGRFDQAQEMFNDVIAEREAVLGADSPELADSYNDLGFLHLAANKFTDAQVAFKRAAAIRMERSGEENLGVAEFLTNLAFAYREDKDFPQAKEYFEKVLAIQEKCLPAKHPGILRATEDLAHAYLDLGDKAKADELFSKVKA